MSDEYNFVAKGKLKLKSDCIIKKKKKDKKKEKEAAKRSCLESGDAQSQSSSSTSAHMNNHTNNGPERNLTDAEKKFKKQQEKMRQKRIMEMASTTHKQRVEKFNEHLDSLTEHFDIPKVSWTK